MRVMSQSPDPLARMHTMTGKKVKSGTIDVKAVLAGDEEFLRALVRTALEEVLEAEMTEALSAEKGERAAGRQGYRSGYYGRTLITRVGKLELRVSQDRSGRFSTELFERYQRSERALVAALAARVLGDRAPANHCPRSRQRRRAWRSKAGSCMSQNIRADPDYARPESVASGRRIGQRAPFANPGLAQRSGRAFSAAGRRRPGVGRCLQPADRGKDGHQPANPERTHADPDAGPARAAETDQAMGFL